MPRDSLRLSLLLLRLRAATTAALLALSSRASAQTQAPTIDTARGSISGGTRLIGLAGAFVAVAEDTDGVPVNPASVALRLPYSWYQWDYGVGADVAVGAWLPKNDLWNQAGTDDVSKSSALFAALSGIVYYRHAGLGVSAEAQSNAATRKDQTQGFEPTDLTANFGVVHASLAYGFLDGQFVLGAGPRLVGASFDRHASGGGSGPLSATGIGYEIGAVLKPLGAQYRVGLVARSAISASVPDELDAPARAVHVPWELAFGFAYQFGDRPFNPRFVTLQEVARADEPEREPSRADLTRAEAQLFGQYRRLPRWYLLVSSELSLKEGGGGQLGIEQYWSQEERGAAGTAQPVLSPRLGLEAEVVPDVLRLRAGSYYEPTPVGSARGRFHGAGGLDVKLFRWDIFGLLHPFDYWQLSLAVDGARAYLNTAFSIGFWH